MLKLPIVLCAVLFAATANAWIIRDTLESIQRTKQEYGLASISNHLRSVIAIDQRAQVSIRTVAEMIDRISGDVSKTLSNALSNVYDDINELGTIVSTAHVNIEECLEMPDKLARTTALNTSRLTRCIERKGEEGFEYKATVDQVSNVMLAALNEMKRQIEQCDDHMNGFLTVVAAKYCASQLIVRDAWFFSMNSPKLYLAADQLDAFLGNLRSRVAECPRQRAYEDFEQEAVKVVSETKKCIEEKVEKARTTTTTQKTIESSEKDAINTATGIPTLVVPNFIQSTEKDATNTATRVPTLVVPNFIQSTEKDATKTNTVTDTIVTPKIIPVTEKQAGTNSQSTAGSGTV